MSSDVRKIYRQNKAVINLGLPWILLFLVLHTPFYQDGDVNAYSRYATMRAMSMENTFHIDNLRHWTIDWAQSPNGHYYSNKAPGPMMLGYPVFWFIDRVKLLTSDDFDANYTDRWSVGVEHKVGVPLMLQILPLCLLVLFVIKMLKDSNVGDAGITFAVVALLFGNISSLLMSTWFGHGLAACLVIAFFVSLHYEKYRLVGLFLGLGILSDYSIALLIPGVGLFMAYSGKISLKFLQNILVGAALPAILWIWYHWVCFGNPFAIPNMFQNPQFGQTLAGQFQFPEPYYMMVLLFGDERGILYTQPWVLVALVLGLVKFYRNRDAAAPRYFLLVGTSFVLLLIMNSSFTGWHGGSTPGPRYLTPALPLLAIVAALFYDRSSPMMRHLLWVFLGMSVLFGGLVYATTILAFEYYTIWTWLMDYLIDGRGSWIRLAIYFIAIAAVSIYVFKFRLKVTIADIYNSSTPISAGDIEGTSKEPQIHI